MEEEIIVPIKTPRAEARRFKKKKRHPNLVTSHLNLYEALKSRNLNGLIIGTAVYLCVDKDVIGILDAATFGFKDGGPNNALYVKETLASLGVNITGNLSVRISLDEAFFLSFAVEVLTVYGDVNGIVQPLDTTTLWRRFNELRSDFLTLYLAYHHFRSKGWIPRTGLQYGADMVLYARHPAITHSDYSVLVVPLNFDDRPPGCLHELQILNRLTSQVSKHLLLFYVEKKGDCDTSTPDCIWQFAVQERLVRRWVPESGRPSVR